MAYALHIKRIDPNDVDGVARIPLDEWKAALSTVEGVRLCPPGANTITNPKSGEVISIPRRDGDAEVYFPDEGDWYPVFDWFKGRASMNARFEPGDASHPVWRVAVELASILGAQISGDDGDVYDLQTGKVMRG